MNFFAFLATSLNYQILLELKIRSKKAFFKFEKYEKKFAGSHKTQKNPSTSNIINSKKH